MLGFHFFGLNLRFFTIFPTKFKIEKLLSQSPHLLTSYILHRTETQRMSGQLSIINTYIFRTDYIWWLILESVSGAVCTLYWSTLHTTGPAYRDIWTHHGRDDAVRWSRQWYDWQLSASVPHSHRRWLGDHNYPAKEDVNLLINKNSMT